MQKLDRFYINGDWTAPISAQSIPVINPATNTTCLSMACAGEDDVVKAIKSARAAFPDWAASTASLRRDLLLSIADEMEARREDLIDAHTMCMGIPRHQAWDFQIAAPIDAVRYYAELCTHVESITQQGNVTIMKEPIGVCVLINPWNYPLMQMIGKLAPALAAGCTVVAKPAEQTPLPDVIMAEILHKVGLPKGVFNLIMGIGAQIGETLCSHPDVDMVSFTGSTAAGIKVAQAAAPTVKRVCQELGGKSPLIITEDADLNAAVRYGVENVILMGGQTCDALSRMLVPAHKYDEAIQIVKAVISEQVAGDPLGDKTTIGPLASHAHRDRVLNYINIGIEEGATLLAGGPQRPEGCDVGAYVQPTLFGDVTTDMQIAREEIFGPVLCIMKYDTIDEAIKIANDTEFGLSSGVYAKDKAAALNIAKHMQSGQCYIQGGTFTIHAPFGGYKQSGNGREWAEDGLSEYLETKAIIAG